MQKNTVIPYTIESVENDENLINFIEIYIFYSKVFKGDKLNLSLQKCIT